MFFDQGPTFSVKKTLLMISLAFSFLSLGRWLASFVTLLMLYRGFIPPKLGNAAPDVATDVVGNDGDEADEHPTNALDGEKKIFNVPQTVDVPDTERNVATKEGINKKKAFTVPENVRVNLRLEIDPRRTVFGGERGHKYHENLGYPNDKKVFNDYVEDEGLLEYDTNAPENARNSAVKVPQDVGATTFSCAETNFALKSARITANAPDVRKDAPSNVKNGAGRKPANGEVEEEETCSASDNCRSRAFRTTAYAKDFGMKTLGAPNHVRTNVADNIEVHTMKQWIHSRGIGCTECGRSSFNRLSTPRPQPRLSPIECCGTDFLRLSNNDTVQLYLHGREVKRTSPYTDKGLCFTPSFLNSYKKVTALNQHSCHSLIDWLNDSSHESYGRFARGKHLHDAASISNFSVSADDGIIAEQALHVGEDGEIGICSSPIPQDVNALFVEAEEGPRTQDPGPWNYHWRLDTLIMQPFFRWNLRPAASEVASGGFYCNGTDLLICYGCNKRHRLTDFSEMPLHANLLHEPNCEFRHCKLCRFCIRGEESIGPDDHEECVQCGRQLLMRTVNTDPTPAQELVAQPENQARAFVDPQCCVEGCRNLLGRYELVEICTVCHGQVCNQCSREGRRHIHY